MLYLALLLVQIYPCSGVASCWPVSMTHFCSTISCPRERGHGMAVEHFVDRRRPFYLQRFINTYWCIAGYAMHKYDCFLQRWMWCTLMASLTVGPLFFEEMGFKGPIKCNVSGKWYNSLLCKQIIPTLPHRASLDKIILMQNGKFSWIESLDYAAHL